jgi:valyl-tRNA synthetase
MFSKLAAVAADTSKALDEFRFHEACKSMYQFFWGDFCDWYIEWVKPELASANRDEARAAWRNIFALLDASIRLLHPVMPFLTEELWHKLPQPDGARTIALDHFPEAQAGWADSNANSKMVLAQDIITVIRNLRAANKIDQKKKLNAEYVTDDAEVLQVIEQNAEVIIRFGGLSTFARGEHKVRQGVVYVGARFEIVLDEQELSGAEKADAIAKLEKEIERLTKDVESKRARLADEAFTSKAPEKVLNTFRSTLKERETELEKLIERKKQLA